MKHIAEIPNARKEGLVVRELADEVLVYDLHRDQAHCLNHTAALVWKYCDGQNTVSEIARHLEAELHSAVDEKLVWYAVEQLAKDHLLEERIETPAALLGGMNRRQMVWTLGIAAVVAVPVVTSIIAPTPAQAATCLPGGSACTSSAQCCSGLCNAGVCA